MKRRVLFTLITAEIKGLRSIDGEGGRRSLASMVEFLALQQQFTAQVAVVERLKVTQRISLAKLDSLFASFPHRAFHGEL